MESLFFLNNELAKLIIFADFIHTFIAYPQFYVHVENWVGMRKRLLHIIIITIISIIIIYTIITVIIIIAPVSIRIVRAESAYVTIRTLNFL